MKKFIIILTLSIMLNIYTTPNQMAGMETTMGHEQKSNSKAQHIDKIEFHELLDAIEKFNDSKIYTLINQVQLNQIQKDIVLKKIDDLIYSKRKKYLISLLIGLPLAYLGYNFLYMCLKQKKEIFKDNRDCNIGFKIGFIEDILWHGLWLADFRTQKSMLDANNNPRIGQSYNLHAILLAIFCTYTGTKFTISAIKNILAEDIRKLKYVKQIIFNKAHLD